MRLFLRQDTRDALIFIQGQCLSTGVPPHGIATAFITMSPAPSKVVCKAVSFPKYVVANANSHTENEVYRKCSTITTTRRRIATPSGHARQSDTVQHLEASEVPDEEHAVSVVESALSLHLNRSVREILGSPRSVVYLANGRLLLKKTGHISAERDDKDTWSRMWSRRNSNGRATVD